MPTQTAIAGRVTKIELKNPDQIQAIEILTPPENGTLTVDPGHATLSYVSTDPGFRGKLPVSWSVTYNDGSTETVEQTLAIESGPQESGWGHGDGLYMLETDDKDDVVVETGDNHRKVYVTGSNDALSRSDIEKMEGLNLQDNKAFAEFLVDHPDYGGSEKMAVDEDVAKVLWNEITGRDAGPGSHWMLFERGYEYSMDRLIVRGTEGEDALHPVHVTAWGEGARPVMLDEQMLNQNANKNIVFSDIAFSDGLQMLTGSNLLFEDVQITGDQLVIQNTDGATLRQSAIVDVFHEEPTHSKWGPSIDRRAGIYSANTEGLLVEQSFFDHTGWEEGYDLSGDPDYGQPPSKFSHNIYLQYDTLDVTFRENVTARAASTGAQLRGGAHAEDNLYLDNNIAVSFGGGRSAGGNAREGNYSYANGNVITSAGHKDAPSIGALSLGLDDYGKMSTLLDNIITHLANPDDPEEIEAKYWSHDALKANTSRFFDDTIIYNWDTAYPYNGIEKKNAEGLSTSSMDETTIQRYAADLLGTDMATIDDLAEHLRGLMADGKALDVTDILNYFRDGFGQELLSARTGTATLTFVPDELAEGTRWDNRINWDMESLPIDGDTVDLNGSFVNYGGTTDLAELRLGGTSVLALDHGYLGADTAVDGGRFEIDGAGQFWLGGRLGDGTLEVDLDGGRFANTGRIGGSFDIEATDGELVLATGGGRFDLDDGSITIVGDEVKFGFDGETGQPSGFDLGGGTLRFVAREDGLGQLTEFRSGAFETSDVTSLVDLDGGGLEIDLSDMTGGGTRTLIAVDGLGGVPDELDVTGLGKRDAVVRVDLAEDRLDVVVKSSGTGQSWIEVADETADESEAETQLWQKIASASVEAPGKISPEDEEDIPDGVPPIVPEPEPQPEQPEPQPEQDDPQSEQEPDRYELDLSAPDTAGMVGHDAGADDDVIEGESAPDFVTAGGGNDYVEGGGGGDALFGGAGQDRIIGGTDADWIESGGDNDHLNGDGGHDTLIGGSGQDRIFGDGGDDILIGGGGADLLVGGAGTDQFVFDFSTDFNAGAIDQIHGFEAGDRIVIEGLGSDPAYDFDSGDGPSVLSVEIDGDMQKIAYIYDDQAGGASILHQDADYLVLG